MEALVEAFKLCVHQVVDHALEDGQVAAAHVAAKEHSRRDGKLLADAGDEGAEANWAPVSMTERCFWVISSRSESWLWVRPASLRNFRTF